MSSKVLRSNGVVLKNAGVSFCYNKNGRSKISSGFKYIQLNNTGPIFKTYSATAGSFFKEDCARSLGGEGDHALTLFTVTSLLSHMFRHLNIDMNFQNGTVFGQARQCQCRLASGRCGMSPRAAIHAERLQGMQHHSPGFRQSSDFSGRQLTDQKPMRESLRLSIHQAQAHAQLRC